MNFNLLKFKKLKPFADIVIKKKYNFLLGNIYKFFKIIESKKILLATFYQKTLKIDIEKDIFYFKKFYQDNYKFKYEAFGYLYLKNINISLEGTSFLKKINKIDVFRDYYGTIIFNNNLFEYKSQMLVLNDSLCEYSHCEYINDIKKSSKNISIYIKNNKSIHTENLYNKLFTLFKTSQGYNITYNNINLLGKLKHNVDYITIMIICCIFKS
tara:strand:- start:2430 stop:3065 length:636 start_codon:yes stop_codon:yes gene_type:complete